MKAGKKGSKIECQYADIIGPVVFAVYHNIILKARAEAHFGTRLGGTLAAFADWLMGMPRASSHSNLMEISCGTWRHNGRGKRGCRPAQAHTIYDNLRLTASPPWLYYRDENRIDKVSLCSNRHRYDHSRHSIQPQHACTTNHPCLKFQTIQSMEME
jgi:hypothetical protein